MPRKTLCDVQTEKQILYVLRVKRRINPWGNKVNPKTVPQKKRRTRSRSYLGYNHEVSPKRRVIYEFGNKAESTHRNA